MYRYYREGGYVIKHDLLTDDKKRVVAHAAELNKLVVELVAKQRVIEMLELRISNMKNGRRE